MNEKQKHENGDPRYQAPPGKFWLWGLALFQLLAVFVMSCAGIGDTATKVCGFAILALCERMDINAVKKHHAVLVVGTGLLPAPRLHGLPRPQDRYGPVQPREAVRARIVWGLLFLLVVGSMASSVDLALMGTQ